MKIEQIIVLHLYTNKQVTLQGIGTFRLYPSISLPSEFTTTKPLPEYAVIFEYDAKATEDVSLVDSIVHYTKKLKPLASSDLDSYLQWQRQLLNISMPYDLPDIGMLQKNSKGQLTFTPCKPPALKIDAKNNSAVSLSFHKYNTAIIIKYGKKLIPVIIIIFCLSLISWLIFEYAINGPNDKKNFSQKNLEIPGNQISPIQNDSSRPLQVKITNRQKADNTYVFKIIFFESKIEIEALNKMNEIYGFGHSAIMYSKDSVYKIAMPFSRPLSDTAHIKDSLNNYYSLGKGSIDVE